MIDKNRFQEMLKDILEVARVQGNQLSIEEVKSLFGDMELSEEQYEQIYAYLAANRIKLKGYMENNHVSTISQYEQGIKQDEIDAEDSEGSGTTETIEKESNSNEVLEYKDSVYLKMYLEDLSAIAPIAEDEEVKLYSMVAEGDSKAKNRLVEGYLTYVVDIARSYVNKGTLLEDLIQEGNIGLLGSIERISTQEKQVNIKEFIIDSIRNHIEDAIGDQEDSSNFETTIIQKIKYISDAAKELEEDLGRDADIYELSEKMKLPVEEIKDILSMSLDAVKVETHHHGNKK